MHRKQFVILVYGCLTASMAFLAGCLAGEEPLPPHEALARAAARIEAILTEERTLHPAGPPAEQARTPQDAGKVTFWYCTHPVYGALLLQPGVLAEFNADHKGVTLSPQYIGDWYVAVQKLVVTLAAGDAPDVALVNRAWLGRLANAGLIAELDALLPEAFIEDVRNPSRDALTLDGRLYALPADGYCSVLFYNRKRVPGNPPATWADLQQLARELAAAAAGSSGSVYAIGDMPFMESLWSAGGYVCDERTCGLDTPEAREALDFILTLRDERLAHPWALGDPERAFDLFLAGDVAMTVASSDHMRRAAKAPFAVGIAPVPGKSGPVSRLSDNVLVVFRKHVEAKRAALTEVLAFLTGPVLLQGAALGEGSVPTRFSLAQEAPAPSELERAYQLARATPLIASWSAVEFELARYLDLAYRYKPSAPSAE